MGRRAQRGPLILDLTRSNPWWTNSSWENFDPHLQVVNSEPFIRRATVLDDIKPPNLYTLRGPRRTGKTTALKQNVARLYSEGLDPRRINYFAADALSTFNDLINLFQAAHQLFPDLGTAPRYFLIDEVTSIPNWQRGMKWLRDNTATGSDCIVATGSSARDIAAGTGDLAGRRGPETGLDRLLLPLSFPDFVRSAGYLLPAPPRLALNDFYTAGGRASCEDALVHSGALADAFEVYLLAGGFPQAVIDFRRRAQVTDGFVRDLWDVVRADLRGTGLSRPEQGLKLLERIAFSLTAPLNLRDLSTDLGIAHSTAGDWLNALADAYLVLLLFRESGGVPEVRAQRKVYPIDPLLGRLAARLVPGTYEPDASQLAEAALATAIFRSVEGDAVDRFGRPGRLFYYRTSSRGEVDFIVLPGPLAIESKYVDTTTARDAAAMIANFGGGLLVTRGAVDIQPGVTVMPAAIFAWLLDQKG